jgi:hypothetical protein
VQSVVCGRLVSSVGGRLCAGVWYVIGVQSVGVCSRLRAVDWRAVVLRVVDWYAVAVWSRLACKQLVWYRLVSSRVTCGLVCVVG